MVYFKILPKVQNVNIMHYMRRLRNNPIAKVNVGSSVLDIWFFLKVYSNYDITYTGLTFFLSALKTFLQPFPLPRIIQNVVSILKAFYFKKLENSVIP